MVPPQGLWSCGPSASLIKTPPSQRGLPCALDLKMQHLTQHPPIALLSLPPPHTLQVLPVCLPLCHHVTSMTAGTIVCVFTVVSPMPRTESSANQMLKYLVNKLPVPGMCWVGTEETEMGKGLCPGMLSDGGDCHTTSWRDDQTMTH